MAAYTTIDNAGAFYNTLLYTGTGSSLALTGVGFQPDFTWVKNRTATDFHVLTDAVRGATKYLKSNETTIETTDAESLKSFDSDGFTVGTQAQLNTNTETYVAWNWKAGTTTGLATNGSTTITPSSYSFNQTSGISILKYTGNTSAGAKVAHGLGVAPKMVIVKNLDDTDDWTIYHQDMDAIEMVSNTPAPEDYGMYFNNTDAKADNVEYWNDTVPDSVNFTVGVNARVNAAEDYVAYCFADIPGFSRMGGYYGSGNANGQFTYTGFKPAFIMVKRADVANDWILLNNKMSLYNNETGDELYADNDQYQNPFTDGGLDFYSNGFKCRGTNASLNASSGIYIYMAFADSPFVNSNGTAGTTR
tara:strand:+ start:437 stop:1519 length:1083 start_codon:yes stop_codon:yes gene_type:complete